MKIVVQKIANCYKFNEFSLVLVSLETSSITKNVFARAKRTENSTGSSYSIIYVPVTFQANQGFIFQVRKILNTVKINFTP